MPASWSQKQERKFNRIKSSCLARDGRKTRQCAQMAAATVNDLSGLGGLVSAFPVPLEFLFIGAMIWAVRRT